jgi:hypothetical protein
MGIPIANGKVNCRRTGALLGVVHNISLFLAANCVGVPSPINFGYSLPITAFVTLGFGIP